VAAVERRGYFTGWTLKNEGVIAPWDLVVNTFPSDCAILNYDAVKMPTLTYLSSLSLTSIEICNTDYMRYRIFSGHFIIANRDAVEGDTYSETEPIFDRIIQGYQHRSKH